MLRSKRLIRIGLLAALLSTIGLAGCGGGGGGGGGGAPALSLSNVKVDQGRAATATVGPEGGTLKATGADGSIYTLTIPENALLSDTVVSMYPATSIVGFPLAAGVRAGVHLTPEGLKLHGPATLTMDLVGAVDPKQLVGLAYQGNAQEQQLFPAVIAGQKVTFAIVHFSGYDLGNASANELINIPVFPGVGQQAQQNLVTAFNVSRRTGQDPSAAYTRALHDWYVGTNGVRSRLQQGGAATSLTSGGSELFIDALSEYDAWIAGVKFAIVTGDTFVLAQTDDAEAKTLAAVMLRNEIRLDNERCVANASSFTGDVNDFESAKSPLFLAAQVTLDQADAHRWGIDTRANKLDLETVLNELCVKVVIQSAAFPSDLKPGQSATLRVQAGVTIAGGPIRHDIPIKVKLSRGGAAAGVPSNGITDAQGVFSASVGWPEGVTELKVDILACIAAKLPSKICRFDQVRKTSSGGGGTAIQTGVWSKADSVWQFSGFPPQKRGLRIEISRAADGSTHIKGFQPPAFAGFPSGAPLFEFPISSSDGRNFAGGQTIPEDPMSSFFFNAWTINVTGSIQDNGFLHIQWGGFVTASTSTSVTGADDLPPGS